jgi:hypothetical protein
MKTPCLRFMPTTTKLLRLRTTIMTGRNKSPLWKISWITDQSRIIHHPSKSAASAKRAWISTKRVILRLAKSVSKPRISNRSCKLVKYVSKRKLTWQNCKPEYSYWKKKNKKQINILRIRLLKIIWRSWIKLKRMKWKSKIKEIKVPMYSEVRKS